MHPAISTSGYSAYVYNPSPPSCTIRLMNLVWAASFTTTSGRILSAVEMLTRRGLELVNSRPQNVLYSPATIHVSLSELAPSMTARSPGYWRMTTGAVAVPATVLRKDPLYVPPRTQIVSPGWTRPPAPCNAVRRSQGRAALPSAAGEPFGAA